ncbi:chemotaxis response regulator protein-glutamate methylesterase [Acidaminobacter sp. JC074]|uniref:protein-glutamate methylesterase/protein-glutamine glutaminase n=1 Tax=Acidaminobacter sp. JC074 TaxID=2530199 RepID=UPI001F0F0C2C|nr:chemotaxis response regulator protein-glutamate methylesterase [Acidaminobacter sp. JC074]
MPKVKVLIVDDSAFMRKILTDILSDNTRIEVVGTAKNGKDALDQIKVLKPDIVTLDVEMPVMDGITALKHIVKEHKIPVVMLSSLTQAGADLTIEALEIGAVDFITKPTSIFKINTDEIKNSLVDKILEASKVSVTKVSRLTSSRVIKREKHVFERSNKIKNIVAIGTSTGGPRALQSVVTEIPGDISAAVLIVQHMPVGFTKSLADRLNTMSDIDIKEAEHGDILKPGCGYLAPGGYQMEIKKRGSDYVIQLDDSRVVSGHRPSVDAMLYSIVKENIKNTIGVIMTGMGSDGADGLLKLKSNGKVKIIAQDEDSCVVYGMPGSAVKNNSVDVVVPLNNITKEIMKAMGV